MIIGYLDPWGIIVHIETPKVKVPRAKPEERPVI